MTSAPSSQRGFDRDRLARIAAWQQRYVDERRFPGSSILIVRGGDEVYFNATGLRNVEDGLPFTRDTVARIYSMTKPVTSVAVMMLAELGMLHLAAPVSEYIPSFKNMRALVRGATRIDQVEPCAVPTVQQLMTHTSGLSYPFNPGLLPKAMDDARILFKSNEGTLADVVDRVAAMPLAFHPGSRWEYSVATDILGRVVEVVSGLPLDQFLASQIFEPLGMTQTGFSVREGTGDLFASLYTPLEGNAMALNAQKAGSDTLRLVDRAGASPFESATTFSGGGGLVGTIDDYRAFADMLRQGGDSPGGRLLSPRTLDFMMRNHLNGDIASMGPRSFAEMPMEGMGFGLGGSVVLDPGRTAVPSSVGDFGWGGMASTFFWVDRVLDLTVVFFTQLTPSSSYPARPELKALVHGALVA